MREAEMIVRSLQLSPKFPDAEIGVTGHCVVHKYNPAGLHFVEPVPEVVRYGLIRMKAVNMKNVYRFVAEIRDGLIKRRPE